MLQIGIQTKNVVYDSCPEDGYELLKRAGFQCADFSLNSYLLNTDLYHENVNQFFDKSIGELEQFFARHKQAAKEKGVFINQMHMPYPVYIPQGNAMLNDYLLKEVAPKSLHICKYMECPYIVIHGFKMARYLGSEEAEWQQTEKFIDFIAPLAKEMGIIICVENLYNSVGGHLIEGPCCDVKKMIKRVDKINDKYHAEVLGFCFDTGHANLVGIDFESFITMLEHRLKVLHIHDNDGLGDLHQIPFTFTKTRENKASTDWDGFIRGLRNIRYDKVLSFETAPVLTTFPEEMKCSVLAFIAGIGRYFAEKVAG